MSITPQGFAQGASSEVEVNTRALRLVARPVDYSRYSTNLLSQISGQIGGNQAANTAYFSMIYGGDYLALVKKITIGVCNVTAFTPGAFTVQLFFARFASASASGGTTMQQGLTNPHDGKLRTRMRRNEFGGISLNTAAQMVIAPTVPLTYTATPDVTPLASMTTGCPTAVANSDLIPQGTKLWVARPGEHPIVLGMQDGLVIRVTPPATGAWFMNVNARWDEVPAY